MLASPGAYSVLEGPARRLMTVKPNPEPGLDDSREVSSVGSTSNFSVCLCRHYQGVDDRRGVQKWGSIAFVAFNPPARVVSGNGKLQEHASITKSGHILRPQRTMYVSCSHLGLTQQERASQQVFLAWLREASTEDVDYTVPASLTERRLLNYRNTSRPRLVPTSRPFLVSNYPTRWRPACKTANPEICCC